MKPLRMTGIFVVLAYTASAWADFKESEYVNIGGIDQWISIRGTDRDNPILLILHGGPGFSNAVFAHAFDPWQNQFTLVDWDQRGAGRTFSRNGPENSLPLTLDQLTADGIELARHLRRRFGHEKVAIFAMSFGSAIGLKMVTEEPDLFYAYVSTGQIINRTDGDKRGYELTLAEARRRNEKEAISALEAIGPPPWPDAQTWSAAKGFATRMTREEDPASKMRIGELMQALPEQGYSEKEISDMVSGARFTAQQLKLHESTFDARQFAIELDVPIYIFQGARDLNAVTSLVEEWFKDLKAPRKELKVIPNASHGAFYANVQELHGFLVETILPTIQRK